MPMRAVNIAFFIIVWHNRTSRGPSYEKKPHPLQEDGHLNKTCGYSFNNVIMDQVLFSCFQGSMFVSTMQLNSPLHKLHPLCALRSFNLIPY